MQTGSIEGFRLSPQQKQLWSLNHSAEINPYLAQCSVDIHGVLDVQRLQTALETLVQRYEILRTQFAQLEGMSMPLQVVGEVQLNWQTIQTADRQTAWDEALGSPIDVAQGPVLWARLLSLSTEQHQLILTLPALTADLTTLNLLVYALEHVYDQQGQPDEEIAQYIDLAEWLNDTLATDANEPGPAFWHSHDLQRIANPVLATLADPSPSFTPALHELTIATPKLPSQALASWLLAAWQVVLWRNSNQTEFQLGLGLDGRNYAELEPALGLFAKHVPFFAQIKPELRFSDLVSQTQTAYQQATTWQEYWAWEQFSDAASHHLDYCFSYVSLPQRPVEPALRFNLSQQICYFERFVVKLELLEIGDIIQSRLVYDAQLLSAEFVQRLAEQLATVCQQVQQSDQLVLGELAVVGASERQFLLELNRRYQSFDPQVTIPRLFAAQAQQYPIRQAVVFEDQALTYQELDRYSNQLAQQLRAHGAQHEQVVAIYLERSLASIVAILGVLKAGAAYLPIDPSVPTERVELMLADSRAVVVITEQALQTRLGHMQSPLVFIDQLLSNPPQADLGLNVAIQPEQLAYIIYTSGSTGKPKGVAIEHRQLANYVQSIIQEVDLQPGMQYAMVSTLAADLGHTVLFPALCHGGTLHLIAQDRAINADAMAEYMHATAIDVLKIVPSHLTALLAASQPAHVLPKQRLVLGGEASSWDLIERLEQLAPACTIVNHYGPTETTVGVLTTKLSGFATSARGSIVPLGRPITNSHVYVLDAAQQLVPFGAIGELYIGGAGVARGYLNRPELTNERFVTDRLSANPHDRLYRSGDLVRYRPDGLLEFLGRSDDQVKIRGYRVELGEISHTLERHPLVQQSTVQLREQANGEKQLVGYVVPNPALALPVSNFLRFKQQGIFAEHEHFELPNGMLVVHQNRHMTVPLYNEIFEDQVYVTQGIQLNDGDCVFDVGANIGLFSLFIGQNYRNIRLFSFEPIPATCQVLRLNAELYGLNAHVFECGIADAVKQETFTHYPHFSGASGRFADVLKDKAAVQTFDLNIRKEYFSSTVGALVGDQEQAFMEDFTEEWMQGRWDSEQIVCQLRTISDVISEHNVQQIDLLKIDAERSEIDVLKGIAPSDWPKIRQIAMEVHSAELRDEIKQLLEAQGYHVIADQAEQFADTALFNIYALQPAVYQANQQASARPTTPTWVWCNPTSIVNELQRHSHETLPEPMQPAAMLLLPAIPLTANGKIDRQALPAPEQTVANTPTTSYVAPRNTVEDVLAGIWAKAFNQPRIGIHDKFFDLGGHSLMATQLIARIQQAFHVQVPLRSLFDTPTIAGLAEQIDASLRAGSVLRMPPITAVAHDQALPLSFTQERYWILDQFEPGNPAYNVPTYARLKGPLSHELLERALTEIVQRHAILRTTFTMLDDQPMQIIHPEVAVRLPLVDLTDLPIQEREHQARQIVATEARTSFDLAQGPLFRGQLIRLDETDHILLIMMHHIITDDWSKNLLIQELTALSWAYFRGEPSPLPPLTIQYADFAHWQRQWFQGEVLESQLAYWVEQLEDAPMVLNLPLDRPRPALQNFQGLSLPVYLPRRLTDQLAALSLREGVTMAMTLLAGFQTLLHRYSGQSDIVIGSYMSGRGQVGTEHLIGFFLNTLPLRVSLAGDPSFEELLKRVQEVSLGAYSHQDLPFEKLLQRLQPEHNLSHTPIFQVGIQLVNALKSEAELGALTISDVESSQTSVMGTAQLDLTLTIRGLGSDEGLNASFIYDSTIFEQTTIARMAGHLRQLLESIVAQPELPISQLNLLSESETEQLLDTWAGDQAQYSSAGSIQEWFANQVAQQPTATAIVFGEQQLSYAELDQRSSWLAGYLQSLGVDAFATVGICMQRSPELIVAMLGVLKAGAGYVPLDPATPTERIRFILRDTAAPVLLTQAALKLDVAGADCQIVALDQLELTADQPALSPLPSSLLNDLPVYTIYTSGSTGTPKGVPISQRNLLPMLRWGQAYFGLGQHSRVLQTLSYAFDFGAFELLTTMLSGGILFIAPAGQLEDLVSYRRLIERWQINTIHATPAFFAEVVALAQPMPTLEIVHLGGDALQPALVKQIQALVAPTCRIYNGYGPTEASVNCAIYQIESERLADVVNVPIGRVTANHQLYILDAQLRPVPIGVVGELCVAGPSLSQGYLHQPALSAEKFVPNPFATQPGQRLYRTGDVARYLPDGLIEHLGRIDHQVKVRGYRIELGEIEAALLNHPAVQEAVVLPTSEASLIGYVVLKQAGSTPTSALREFLQQRLPGYMLPATLVPLESLPRTANGKINRQALLDTSALPERETPFVAPQGEIEEAVVQIWMEVLKRDNISVHDNFFHIGGHSLLGTQVIYKLAKALQINISLQTLFKHPTPATLALAVEDILLEEIEHLSDEELALLSQDQP